MALLDDELVNNLQSYKIGDVTHIHVTDESIGYVLVHGEWLEMAPF